MVKISYIFGHLYIAFWECIIMDDSSLNPNRQGLVLVFVNKYKNHDISGNFSMPFAGFRKKSIRRPRYYYSIWDLIQQLDAHFDDIKYPQKHNEIRAFQDNKKESLVKNAESEMKEFENMDPFVIMEKFNKKKNTISMFAIDVRYRYNVSWQGSLLWLTGNKKSYFRSVYELMSLIIDGVEHDSKYLI